MKNSICLDKNYSTTRLVTKERPEIFNNSENKILSVLFMPAGEGRKGEGGLRINGYYKKSFQDKPLFSIITVVLNCEKYIEKTILSVLNQKYDNIEYIIIDGGSKDATVDIIRKYEDYIDYWVSELDNGIYDAMNKGISLACGQGLLFLNAGDYFVGNVISEDVKPPCFLRVKYINFFNTLVDIKVKNYRLGLPYCHQGIMFENKKILYSLEYKVSSDYDYYLKYGYKYLKMQPSKGYIYFDNNGYNQKNRKLRDSEIKYIIKRQFGNLYAIIFQLKVFFKNIIRRLFQKS
jgi:glycosyltransferase involved in cell wall biosynthesis